MRILLLVQNYYPNIQSSGRLIHDLAVVYRDLGHDVLVLAPDAHLSERRTVSSEDGFTVVRVRSGAFRDVPLAKRAFHEWRLSTTLWKGAKDILIEQPCHLIVSYAPTIFFGSLVARLRSLWSCPAYLVLRDIFPQWCVEAGLMRRGGAAHRFFTHYENLLYRTVDVIGVEAPGSLEYFSAQSDLNVEVLYNWAKSSDQEVDCTQQRSALGLEGKTVFFYGGNVGVAQDASCFIRLAESIRSLDQVHFVIVGSGSEMAHLERDANERGLKNISFLPPVGPAQYLGLVSEFDVGLVSLNSKLEGHNFPGKLFDYMYFGKPILAAINPGNDLRNVLKEHQVGLVCENGEDDRLQTLARMLIDDPSLRQTLGTNSRRLLEEFFAAERAAQQILDSVRIPS